ncbi:UNVERIFIED_CONTAM: hypothetical protein FKN15_066473 [Acipenser sinensis]
MAELEPGGSGKSRTGTELPSSAIFAWIQRGTLLLVYAVIYSVVGNPTKQTGVPCVQGRNQQRQSHSSVREGEHQPRGPQPFQGFGDAGFHMSFGIGAFPFGGFTTVFNSNMHNYRADHNGGNPGNGNPNSWQDSLFLFVAIFFFFWLLSV